MQGILGHSHSLLLQALNNVADGSLRLALRVKINEKIDSIHLTSGEIFYRHKSYEPGVFSHKIRFPLIFMQDSGRSHPVTCVAPHR